MRDLGKKQAIGEQKWKRGHCPAVTTAIRALHKARRRRKESGASELLINGVCATAANWGECACLITKE